MQSHELPLLRCASDPSEADGTFAWDATTLVVVEAAAGGTVGVGYTYADPSTARFIAAHLRDVVVEPLPGDPAQQQAEVGTQVQVVGGDADPLWHASTVRGQRA